MGGMLAGKSPALKYSCMKTLGGREGGREGGKEGGKAVSPLTSILPFPPFLSPSLPTYLGPYTCGENTIRSSDPAPSSTTRAFSRPWRLPPHQAACGHGLSQAIFSGWMEGGREGGREGGVSGFSFLVVPA